MGCEHLAYGNTCRGYVVFWLLVSSLAVLFSGCTSPTGKVSENALGQRIVSAAVPAEPANIPEQTRPVPALSVSDGVNQAEEPENPTGKMTGREKQVLDSGLKAPHPPATTLSLQQSILYAKKHNPRLRILRERVNQARAGKQIAFSAFLPEAMISYRAIWGTDKFVLPTVPSLLGNMAFGETADHFRSAELNLQWVVWDFGRTPGRYQQAQAARDIAELQYDRGIQTVVYNTTAAYFNLLQKKAMIRVAKEAVRRAKSLLRDARNYVAQGTAIQVDVLQAERLLAEMQLALVSARSAGMVALAGLNRVMGFHVSSHTKIAEKKAQPVFTLSLDECLQRAVTFRDEFRSVLKAISSSQWGLAASQAKFLPRIIAGGTGAHHDGQPSGDRYFLAGGVKIELALFEGTRRFGEVEKNRAEVREAMARAEEVADGIAFEVIVAYTGIQETREGISYSRTAVARGEESLKVLRHLFKSGDATATDVIDAEWALISAKEHYFTALYQYRIALAQLDYAVGTSGLES